jgi:hypothetical protein
MPGWVLRAPPLPDLGCTGKMQDEAAPIVQTARCFVSGEGQVELEKACADSRRSFSSLMRIAAQVVASGALVEFSTLAASR